ncbi:MAG: hypothetical protein M0025_12110 [Elusimicrobia bacterium]|nr:hypothetical protein [Elusimicrobiota bacterium]
MKTKVILLFMSVTLLLAYFAHRRGKPVTVPSDLRDSVITVHGSSGVPGLAPQCLSGGLPHRAAAAAAWDGGGALAAGVQSSPMAQGVYSCLSCHDGTVAPADKSYSAALGFSGGAPEGGSAGNHPVGVDYGEAMRARPGEYNDPHSNPDIRLSGNKVTCLSCHASELTAGLQMPGGQTALCLSCHRL